MSGWQLEMGAQVAEGGRVRFRVWAPAAHKVEVEIYPPPSGIVRYSMTPEGDGLWTATVEGGAGTLYRYRLNEERGYPDPYSRSQPEGAHGPSKLVDPRAFGWTDGAWRGLDPESLVIYELHVGAYTPEGTFDALIGQLDELQALGVTALELLPVVEFPGRRGWGYDGASLFAASSAYGGPEGLRRLVDAAHVRGLGVILDAVYSHLGPEGNYLGVFSSHYFTDRHDTRWGDAFNFDGPESGWVRRFVVDNALFWLHEYHIDGLRLDATQDMRDESATHILRELSDAVHERPPQAGRFLLIAENAQHDLRLLTPRQRGGYGLDGLWADDFHHSLHVLLTAEGESYFADYDGSAEEIARLLRDGLIYCVAPPQEETAEVAPPQEETAEVAPRQLVYCLENHDQVGNRSHGQRLSHLTDAERLKAAAALLLLAPCTPMIFMGSEFASSRPFLYFTDLPEELREQVLAGRRAQFGELWASFEREGHTAPDPQSEETFLRSKLDLSERTLPGHRGVYELHRELLRLRREHAALRSPDRRLTRAEAPASDLLTLERWDGDERWLLLVNFGEARRYGLGDGAGRDWRALLCTAEDRFEGPGADLATIVAGGRVALPARCALLLAAEGG